MNFKPGDLVEIINASKCSGGDFSRLLGERFQLTESRVLWEHQFWLVDPALVRGTDVYVNQSSIRKVDGSRDKGHFSQIADIWKPSVNHERETADAL